MKKIRASTLTEVITALVIITIISGMFFAIILKAGNYHQNRRKLIINQQFSEIVGEAKQEQLLFNETFEHNGYYIDKTIEPYKKIPKVWQIKLEAYDKNNQLITEHIAIFEIYKIEDDY